MTLNGLMMDIWNMNSMCFKSKREEFEVKKKNIIYQYAY